MVDGIDDESPLFRVVSDNPNARTERQTKWAKEDAERAFSQFAASLLRTMAGSESEAIHLFRHLSRFIDAQNEFKMLSGRSLTLYEIEQALRLPRAQFDSSDSDIGHRRWLRSHGMDLIVQGALRLAAHKILDERPHFGGKYSESVIENGIQMLEEWRRPPPKPAYSPNRNENARHVTAYRKIEPELPRPASRSTVDSRATGSAPIGARKRQGKSFGQEDLKELRKAIKARDEKKISELTSKIGNRRSDD